MLEAMFYKIKKYLVQVIKYPRDKNKHNNKYSINKRKPLKFNGLITYLVENKGLEPLTPCVQGRCSEPTELIPQKTITD